MSVWQGWQADLLAALHAPNNAANRAFLTAWHNHAESNCTRNPVDISKQVDPWSACKHLGPGRTANNYGTRKAAEDAFHGQMLGTEFLSLSSGLFNSSLAVTNVSANVIAELRVWGSSSFADFLATGGGGGGGTAGGPTHFHQGWNDLRRSVNKRYPNALTDSKKLTDAALRKLAHARKVRI